MNVKIWKKLSHATTALISIVAIPVLLFSSPLWARDIDELLTTPFVDPLHTRPDVLDKGVVLPGDTAPWQCKTSRDFSTPLSLNEAVDLALCNNAQVKMAWATIKVQAAAVGTADAAYLPIISATVSRLRTQTSYPDSGIASSEVTGNTVYGSFNWRLFDFGTRAANRQSANSALTAALADHDASLQKTLAQTIQAYFDVQSTHAILLAKEQGEAIASETLESARRREAKGIVARSDTLQANTALAKASLDKNRAMGDYQKSMSILIYALGLPAGTHIVLAEETDDGAKSGKIEKFAATQTEDLDMWLRNAEQFHPAIQSARAQWEAAQSNIASARASGLPTVDFTANNYQNGYPGQGLQSMGSHINSIGISVSIPIFDGFSTTYKIRNAQAQAEQHQAQLEDVERNVLMEVVKAHADAVSSLKNLQSSEDLLDAAQEALATSQRKYNKGAADILEILGTQGSLADAKQERIRCIAEWRSARLRLLANVGTLGMSSIQ
jgi:outer membrane protein